MPATTSTDPTTPAPGASPDPSPAFLATPAPAYSLAVPHLAAWLVLALSLIAIALRVFPASRRSWDAAAYLAAWASLGWLVWHGVPGLRSLFRRTPPTPGASTFVALAAATAPRPTTPPLARLGWRTILGLGIVVRLLFLAYPASDDVNRYAWEGWVQGQPEHANPYVSPPADRAMPGDAIRAGVNHPELTAAYPPLIMLVHQGLARVAGYQPPQADPAAVYRTFKVAALLVDGLTLFILARLLLDLGRPVAWLALYAFNPLVLVWGVGEAHLDVYQNLLLALALYGFFGRRVRPWLAWPALGAAVLVKYFAVILMPFCLRRDTWRWAPLALVPGFAWLLYLEPGMFASLLAFGREYHYNDALPRLFRATLGMEPAQRLAPLTLAILLAVLLAALHFMPRLAARFGPRSIAPWTLAWLALLVCLPTVHPWYLLPLMLLAALAPSPTVCVLAATQAVPLLVQHHHLDTGVWREMPYQWAWVWLPPLFVAIAEAAWRWHRHWQRNATPPAAPPTPARGATP